MMINPLQNGFWLNGVELANKHIQAPRATRQIPMRIFKSKTNFANHTCLIFNEFECDAPEVIRWNLFKLIKTLDVSIELQDYLEHFSLSIASVVKNFSLACVFPLCFGLWYFAERLLTYKQPVMCLEWINKYLCFRVVFL